MAIASGEKIEGAPFVCPAPHPVVYISQEDDAEFLRGELLCQFQDLKTKPEIPKRIRIISTILQGPNLFLTDKEGCQLIADNLPDGGVFVLDSWSTCLTSSENDNTELLRNEIASLREIMKQHKASPLVIHHRPKPNPQTGHQSSSRGGTALPNSCRFHMMLESNGAGVRLSFEKVSRGAKPDPINLVFDEERKLFVPKELDRYVAIFQPGEQFTLTQFMERLGKDPKDEKERKKALDILRQRSKNGGRIEKLSEGKKGQEAIWRRKSDSDGSSM